MLQQPIGELKDLNKQTARALWELDRSGHCGLLILPRTRVLHRGADPLTQASDGDPRLSEQEARYLFARAVEQRGLQFSLETPTKEVAGKGKSSARFDLTLYSAMPEYHIHVEFKDGLGTDGEKSSEGTYEHDLKKLLKYGVELGGFFVVLQKANTKNLCVLKSRLREAVEKAGKDLTDSSLNKTILIGLCTLKEYPGEKEGKDRPLPGKLYQASLEFQSGQATTETNRLLEGDFKRWEIFSPDACSDAAQPNLTQP